MARRGPVGRFPAPTDHVAAPGSFGRRIRS